MALFACGAASGWGVGLVLGAGLVLHGALVLALGSLLVLSIRLPLFVQQLLKTCFNPILGIVRFL